MGTRNITFVKQGGQKKVAAYCQWDGCPTYRGRLVLEFVHSLLAEGKMDEFRRRIQLSELKQLHSNNVTYTGAPYSDDRAALFEKLSDYRYNNNYMTPIKAVDDMLTKGLLSDSDAEYLVVASRDFGNWVLEFMMGHRPEGMTFYTDTYAYNMKLAGDWQIEGVFLIDLDENSVSIGWHGKVEVFSFDAIAQMTEEEITAAMERLEGREKD